MLFSEMHKIMVNKVTFAGFRGLIAPISRLDPTLFCADPQAMEDIAVFREIFQELQIFKCLVHENKKRRACTRDIRVMLIL